MGLPAGMRRTRDVLVFLAKFVITYAGGRKYLAVFGVCFPMLVFLMMVALGATLHKLGAKAGTPSLLGIAIGASILLIALIHWVMNHLPAPRRRRR